MNAEELPPQQSEAGDRRPDYSGLWILVGLAAVEIAALYVLIAVETPLSPVVRRMMRNPFGVFTMVTIVVTLLMYCMAVLLGLIQRIAKRERTAGRSNRDAA